MLAVVSGGPYVGSRKTGRRAFTNPARKLG